MRIVLAIIAFLVLFSCKSEHTTERRIAGNALGTTYQILYYGDVSEDKLVNAMDSVFQTVNRSMSTYDKDSDISKINEGDTSIVVDAMFTDVFQLSEKIYRQSDGYFDPTVGNLVNAYGFGAERYNKNIDSTLVDSLRQFVGLNMVTLTSEKKIKKDKPEIYLEFNAIAKGYCLDRMAVLLEFKGITNYLIELGGELIANGQKLSKDTNWLAGIEKPNENNTRTVAKTVKLVNRAMATSGNYRKYRIDSETGQKYVHTINPKTGYPEKNDMLSASVFAETCAQADAYATTFMSLGYKKSRALSDSLPDIDVYFMYLDTGNNLQTFASEGIIPFIN